MNQYRTILTACAALTLSTMAIAQPAWKPDRTVEMMITSFSLPWKESTVLTSTSNRLASILNAEPFTSTRRCVRMSLVSGRRVTSPRNPCWPIPLRVRRKSQ